MGTQSLLTWRGIASGWTGAVFPLPIDVHGPGDPLNGKGLGHADTLHSHLMQHTPHLCQAVLADVNRKEGEAGGREGGGGGTYGGVAPVVQDVLQVGAGRQDEVVAPLVPVDLEGAVLVHSATAIVCLFHCLTSS